MEIVHKVAAVILQDRKMLLVRKGTSSTYVSPGGRPEPGESNPEVTLRRALKGELSADIARCRPFRVFTERASSGEAQVLMDTYIVQLASPPKEGPAIADLVWVAANSSRPMAPIVKEHLLPALKEADLVD